MSDGELASLVATIDNTVAVDPLVTTSGPGVNVVDAGLVPLMMVVAASVGSAVFP